MRDIVDIVICRDESWVLVGETGSSSCIGGGMINFMDPFGPLNGGHVIMPLHVGLVLLYYERILAV